MELNEKRSVYIAGKMRGVPLHNFPAFDAAQKRFEESGWKVFNPAQMSRKIGFDETQHGEDVGTDRLAEFFTRDIAAICQCSAIALIPGWSSSEGANAEVVIGKLLGLDFFDAETMAPYSFDRPTNRDRLLGFHSHLCAKARALMTRKNHDYAGSKGDDPYANFRRVESLGVCTTIQGFLVRMTDKLSRLSTFAESGKLLVADEGAADTLIDLINYSVLLAGFIAISDAEVQCQP